MLIGKNDFCKHKHQRALRSHQLAAIADQSHQAEHSLAEEGLCCPRDTTPFATHMLRVCWRPETWKGRRMVNTHLHLMVQQHKARQLLSSRRHLNVCAIMDARSSADLLLPQVCINMSGLGTTRSPGQLWSTWPLTLLMYPHVAGWAAGRGMDYGMCNFGELWIRFTAGSYFVIHGFRTGSINRSLLLDAFKVKDAVALLLLLPRGFIFPFACWIYRFPFSLKVVVILSLGILDGFQIEYCESCINAG